MTDEELQQKILKKISDLKKVKRILSKIYNKCTIQPSKKVSNFTVIKLSEYNELLEIKKNFLEIKDMAYKTLEELKEGKENEH